MNPPDPPEQLRDIHLPEPVPWWPPAPGWWICALVLVVVLAFAWRRYHGRKKARAYRRRGAALLTRYLEQWQQDGDSTRYLQRTNALLRRVALVSFPDQAVAPLTRADWVTFLESGIPAERRESIDLSPLGDQVYRQGADAIDIQALHASAMQWLQAHASRD